MIRLKDIAERAGVSTMTVSKALRDAPDISEATKLRLRALASEMGYVPDSLAQGLRTRNSRLLGVVISAITNPVFARMLLAIEEKASAAGYELLIAHSLNDPDREAVALRRFIARRVEGILVTPVYRLGLAAEVYDELQRCGIPTVILGHRTPFVGDSAELKPMIYREARSPLNIYSHSAINGSPFWPVRPQRHGHANASKVINARCGNGISNPTIDWYSRPERRSKRGKKRHSSC
jgi:transcriptional regulator with XRE-family HTH domain